MHEDKPSQQAYIALVCSILGCLGCGGCITALIGVVLGNMERTKIANGESSPAGQGIATAAMAIGALTIVLYGLLILVYIVIFALGMGSAAMSGGGGY